MQRNSKCTHNERGMCINCLISKQKSLRGLKNQQKEQNIKYKCKHPPTMKCLRCLPQTTTTNKKQCRHPNYQICTLCQNMLKYDTFNYYLSQLTRNCTHKKPCTKCVPSLDRKTYLIDLTCRKHLPYPQAQCQSCMPPSITVKCQNYSHVIKVVINNINVLRIMDHQLHAILLGHEQQHVIYIDDLYFPVQNVGYHHISPADLKSHSFIWENFGLKVVGILSHTHSITPQSLLISSVFQEQYLNVESQHQISQFITMRLHINQDDCSEPHWQSFMVSDQFQSLHKHHMLVVNEKQSDSFDLVTVRGEQLSKLPTFLREGIEVDQIYFKQAIVWIPTLFHTDYSESSQKYYYPYFTAENRDLRTFQQYLQLKGDPFDKYINIQFLVHMYQIFDKLNVEIFLKDFLSDDPELFLRQKLKEHIEKQNNQNYSIKF